MAQLLPLPLTVSCFSKIQIGFTFLVPAHLGSPGKRVVKRVCVCVSGSWSNFITWPTLKIYDWLMCMSPHLPPHHQGCHSGQKLRPTGIISTNKASFYRHIILQKKTWEKQLYTGITNRKITHLWMSCNSLNICTATSKWYIVCMMISAWFLDSLVRQ